MTATGHSDTALTRRRLFTLGGGLAAAGTAAVLAPTAASAALTPEQEQYRQFCIDTALSVRSAAPAVPVSVVIAQAILETGWGTSSKCKYPIYNYFGHKSRHGDDNPHANGEKWLPTKEVFDGEEEETYDWFHTYPGAWSSFRAHFLYVSGQTGMERYQDPNMPSDPDAFAHWLVTPPRSYATGLDYAKTLIRIMNERDLYKYN